MTYTVRPDDLRDADITPSSEGEITRESVQRWIDTHTGDFSLIVDWSASIEDGGETIEFPWQDEESEFVFNDCVFDDA